MKLRIYQLNDMTSKRSYQFVFVDDQDFLANQELNNLKTWQQRNASVLQFSMDLK